MNTQSNISRRIADAAMAFEKQRTGHAPQSASVVICGETLVITLHGSLSEAERALARTPEGAAQVQEFHRRLFASESHTLRREIKHITGIEVRESAAEIEPETGALVSVFASGTSVQVYLLASELPG